MSHNWRGGGGGAYCFWCGSRRRRCSFLSALYLLNQWVVLTILTQTHYWDGDKKWLDFGELDLIFKFWPKKACQHSLLNQMTDSGQTPYIVMLGWFKDLIRFWWHWPYFQGHHTICKHFKFWSQKAWMHPISWTKWWTGQSSYIVMLGWFKDLIRFWWTWPKFSRSPHYKDLKIKWALSALLSPEAIGGVWPNLHRNTTGT